MKRLEELDQKIEEIKTKMNDPLLAANTALVYSRISGYLTGRQNSGILESNKSSMKELNIN